MNSEIVPKRLRTAGNINNIMTIFSLGDLIRASHNTTHSISPSTKKKQGMQGRRLKWAGPIIYSGKYLLITNYFTLKILNLITYKM